MTTTNVLSDAPTETLTDHLDHLTTFAGNFIAHWMEDDGNDADDKARCEQAAEDTDAASGQLRAALDAAGRLLKGLQYVIRSTEEGNDITNGDLLARADDIAQAEAAGIVADAQP